MKELLQDQLTGASGLESISGIPDACSPSAMGKLISAFATGTLRDQPDRFQMILPALLIVPPNARIFTEYGGTGNEYHTLKYRIPDPVTGKIRQKSIYLGQLNNDQKSWMRQILEERVSQRAEALPPQIHLDHERIKQLRDMRDQAHAYARIIARRAGYTWRGFRLLKKRNTT